MAARHRGGGGWLALPALILPVICGFGLLAHYQVVGSGRAFSVWLAETYGLRHGQTASRVVDNWTSALLGIAGPNRAVAGTRPKAKVKLPPATAAMRQEVIDPNQEIRRLLAGRPERGLMSDDFAAARLALARELADAAGILEEGDASANPVAPSQAESEQTALLIQPRTGGEEAEPIQVESPVLATTSPISLGPERKRIFIHYSKVDPRGAETAKRIADHLRGLGFTVADIRSVPYPVKKSSVRFFFADDAEIAKNLQTAFAAGLDASGYAGTPVDIKDFQHYRPNPNRGTIEVWIPVSGS